MVEALARVALAALFPLAVTASPPAAPQEGGTRAGVPLPSQGAGWERVLAGIVGAFDHADVVALGAAHGREADTELWLRLVGHPEFATKVRTIVTESGGAGDQSLVDRYVAGEALSPPDAQAARGPGAYGALVDAVRERNGSLPADGRVRVFPAGRSGADSGDRGRVAVSLLREVVQRGEKALVVFGSGHVWHRHGAITRALQGVVPGRVFVVETVAPLAGSPTGDVHRELRRAVASLDATVSSAERPVLVALRGTTAGRLRAGPFYLGQADVPDTTTLMDLADAVVYFGDGGPAGHGHGVPSATGSGLPPPARVMSVIYRAPRLDMRAIEDRLDRHGIRVRLDAPLDGATACAIREVLKDLMADRGFREAAVNQRTRVVEDARGARLVDVAFEIDEGPRSRGGSRAAALSPRDRCGR